MVTYINREIPATHKAVGQSVLVIAQSGISSILGNIGGGYVSEWLGIRQTYLLIAGIVFAVTIFCGGLYMLRHNRTVLAFFSRLKKH
jgi:predicted MFS family arabinose efflux permease